MNNNKNKNKRVDELTANINQLMSKPPNEMTVLDFMSLGIIVNELAFLAKDG